ncbi:MAG: hypothetical protein J6X58_08085 [Bacteroidales bacterium]|nr:hypothetical protein [Bacteroidales bacterium]
MSTIKKLWIAGLFISAAFAANAQLTHLEQSIFLNFNAPMASFNDDAAKNGLNDYIPMTRFNVGTNAAIGVGIGYRVCYRFDVGFGEVSPYLHADLQWNRIKSDTRDLYLQAGNGSAPNYFNIPIFVGVNYRYQLTDIFTPFGEFGLGPDFMICTKESGTLPSAGGKFEMKYRPTCEVAWQIGAGCYFGQHVSASLHYNGFGKHAIEYTSSTTVPEGTLQLADASSPATKSRNIGLLSLRIGFHF